MTEEKACNSERKLRPSSIHSEILKLLNAKGGMYGLEMINASSKLKKNTIYVHLGRMEERGWLRSEAPAIPGQSGMPKRRYYITEMGLKLYRKWYR